MRPHANAKGWLANHLAYRDIKCKARATSLILQPCRGAAPKCDRDRGKQGASGDKPHRQPTRQPTARGGALRVLHFLKLGVGDVPATHTTTDGWFSGLPARVGGTDKDGCRRYRPVSTAAKCVLLRCAPRAHQERQGRGPMIVCIMHRDCQGQRPGRLFGHTSTQLQKQTHTHTVTN